MLQPLRHFGLAVRLSFAGFIPLSLFEADSRLWTCTTHGHRGIELLRSKAQLVKMYSPRRYTVKTCQQICGILNNLEWFSTWRTDGKMWSRQSPTEHQLPIRSDPPLPRPTTTPSLISSPPTTRGTTVLCPSPIIFHRMEEIERGSSNLETLGIVLPRYALAEGYCLS